jgi:hypothetical protein
MLDHGDIQDDRDIQTLKQVQHFVVGPNTWAGTASLSNLDTVGDRRSARNLLSPRSRHGRFLPRGSDIPPN